MRAKTVIKFENWVLLLLKQFLSAWAKKVSEWSSISTTDSISSKFWRKSPNLLCQCLSSRSTVPHSEIFLPMEQNSKKNLSSRIKSILEMEENMVESFRTFRPWSNLKWHYENFIRIKPKFQSLNKVKFNQLFFLIASRKL